MAGPLLDFLRDYDLNDYALGAKLQVFRTKFDHYEGSLIDLTLDIQHRLNDRFSVGLGYNCYGMKLTSEDSDVNGFVKVRHRGPVAFVALGY